MRVQGAVRLSRASEPQPDVALIAPRKDYYRSGHPAGADTFLLIEVSDATLRYDLDVKVPLYARHGVPEVWIIDLQACRMLSFRSPADGRYRDEISTEVPGDTPIAALPCVMVDLSGLLL